LAPIRQTGWLDFDGVMDRLAINKLVFLSIINRIHAGHMPDVQLDQRKFAGYQPNESAPPIVGATPNNPADWPAGRT
jgi:hypothetical protein